MVLFAAPSERTGTRGSVYGNFVDLDASVVDEDDNADVAVLSVGENVLRPNAFRGEFNGIGPLPKLPRFHLGSPREGEMISVSGFPLSIPVIVTTTGWLATRLFIDERQRFLYLGDVQVNHGNSGGPAYLDSDGAVIGLVVQYRPAPEGNSRLTVIVPIRCAFDLLKPKTGT
ncbi:MAG: S1 family peptidase [Bryobacteraceae bacterium]